MEILIAIGASGYIIYFATVYLEKRKKYKDEVASVRDEYEEWASKEEPRYRNMHTYPPDWHFRKLYVQKRDKYKCNICGYRMVFNDRELKKTIETRRHTMRTGLHVHHKKSLSSGGDNSLGNLICLCESCHENQHPHMLRIKLSKYRNKASRARKPSSIAHWNAQITEIEKRLSRSVSGSNN